MTKQPRKSSELKLGSLLNGGVMSGVKTARESTERSAPNYSDNLENPSLSGSRGSEKKMLDVHVQQPADYHRLVVEEASRILAELKVWGE